MEFSLSLASCDRRKLLTRANDPKCPACNSFTLRGSAVTVAL